MPIDMDSSTPRGLSVPQGSPDWWSSLGVALSLVVPVEPSFSVRTSDRSFLCS